MGTIVLTQWALNKINDDQVLFGKVAKALNISVVSLPRLLKSNNPKLTNAGVVIVLKKHLGVKDSEILEESKSETQTAA